MPALNEYVAMQLDGQRQAHVGEQSLAAATSDGVAYRQISYGFFFPNVGIVGDWNEHEKHAVRRFVALAEEPMNDEERRFRTLRPGDIARLSISGVEYLAAAFQDRKPASGLILLMKER